MQQISSQFCAPPPAPRIVGGILYVCTLLYVTSQSQIQNNVMIIYRVQLNETMKKVNNEQINGNDDAFTEPAPLIPSPLRKYSAHTIIFEHI